MFNISMTKIQEEIKKLTKEDIVNFGKKYNVYLNKQELDFVYNLVKTNNQEILNNPKSFNLTKYKNHFTEENYQKLTVLYNKYSNYLQLLNIN